MPLLFRQIRQGMRRFPRNPAEYIRGLRAEKLETKAAPGVKTVTFSSRMEGEEDGPYLTSIKFFEMDQFSETRKQGFIKAEVGSKEIYTKKPSLNQNPVQIKCSCDDFRFRWEFPLFNQGALIGRFRRYTRKTPPPPVGRPFANPGDHVGFCKHVWNLVSVLKGKSLIKQ